MDKHFHRKKLAGRDAGRPPSKGHTHQWPLGGPVFGAQHVTLGPHGAVCYLADDVPLSRHRSSAAPLASAALGRDSWPVDRGRGQ